MLFPLKNLQFSMNTVGPYGPSGGEKVNILLLSLDIHECTFGSNNCSHIVCTNSDGSFNANCIHGSPWNGLNCSGKTIGGRKQDVYSLIKCIKQVMLVCLLLFLCAIFPSCSLSSIQIMANKRAALLLQKTKIRPCFAII